MCKKKKNKEKEERRLKIPIVQLESQYRQRNPGFANKKHSPNATSRWKWSGRVILTIMKPDPAAFRRRKKLSSPNRKEIVFLQARGRAARRREGRFYIEDHQRVDVASYHYSSIDSTIPRGNQEYFVITFIISLLSNVFKEKEQATRLISFTISFPLLSSFNLFFRRFTGKISDDQWKVGCLFKFHRRTGLFCSLN